MRVPEPVADLVPAALPPDVRREPSEPLPLALLFAPARFRAVGALRFEADFFDDFEADFALDDFAAGFALDGFAADFALDAPDADLELDAFLGALAAAPPPVESPEAAVFAAPFRVPDAFGFSG